MENMKKTWARRPSPVAFRGSFETGSDFDNLSGAGAAPSRMMSRARQLGLLIAVCGLSSALSSTVWAASQTVGDFTENNATSKDSVNLASGGSWVVAPIPKSSPTLGAGLQPVVLYMHAPKDDNPGGEPAITGVGGLYTDNNSYVVGAFHKDYLFQGRLRTMAALGKGKLNLNYFGVGDSGFLTDHPLGYSIEMDVLYLGVQARIPHTEHWYFGPNFLYTQGTVSFRLSELAPIFPDVGRSVNIAALGLDLSYDTRDDSLYPKDGTYFTASVSDYGETWGGDYDYRKYGLSLSHYFSLGPKLVLAANGEMKGSSGDVPFFDMPNLGIRGYESGRFIDDFTFMTRAELRYQFRPRWGFVTFADGGMVNDSISGLLSGEAGLGYGVGVRYRASEGSTLNLSLDVAKTSEDTGIYIRVGEMF
ncbi:surface antigen-like protein [Marinobacterium mangrovicola]|uniref:Surface antigen-like protein n=1 Tax=Marinobacterium mangrovicola TaxID=1476959 RepID=A0A4R1GEL2_9GAMM|nr:surface antigen-like protein [Marinobacterium mangrovicola]